MEKAEFGLVEVLQKGKDVSITMEIILPGKKIPLHYHKERDEIMLIIENYVEYLGGSKMYVFKKNESHGFSNGTDIPLTLLLISKPPYDKKDYFNQ